VASVRCLIGSFQTLVLHKSQIANKVLKKDISMQRTQLPPRSPVNERRSTGGRCSPTSALTTKPLSPWRCNRKSLVAATTLLTTAVFSLDMLLNDWTVPSSLWAWLVGDLGIVFSVMGFVTAYVFLCWRRPRSRPSGCGKYRQASRKQDLVSPAQARLAANVKTQHPESPLSPAPCSGTAMGAENENLRPESPAATSTSTAQVNFAINQAASRGDSRKAAAVLESLAAGGAKVDATSYNLLMRSYAKNNDRHGAECCLKNMCTRGIAPTEYSFNTLMNMCAKSDDAAGVEGWMQQMLTKGVVVTGISYAIVIHTSARQGRVGRAQGWLEKMIDAGLKPDCVHYNSMIHACSVKKDAEGAERWLEKLVEKGLEPTVMTYTALVDACSKSLDVKKAEHWMQQLLGIQQPNVVSFSAMVDACARVGDLERAERWYGKMHDLGVQPNAYIYSSLINACAKHSDVGAACEWLRRAEESGTTLDVVVYGCVIHACGKAGDSHAAMATFRQMRSQGIQSTIVVYGSLARPFAYAGEWEEVERILEEMTGDGISMNDYILYTLLLAYSRAKPRQSGRAEAAFHKALLDGVQPNDRLFKVLASAVGRPRCAEILERLCSSHATPH